MTKDEALNLALEALEYADKDDFWRYQGEAITAIKEALAAPVQKPTTVEDNSQDWAGMDGATAWHLIDRHADGWADVAKMMGEWLAANTPPAAPVQEPVAFLANGTRFKISYDSRQSGGQIHGIPQELGGRWVAFVAAEDDCHLKLTTPPNVATPLAAQRQSARSAWVGLTDEERDDLLDNYITAEGRARAIEAKLKELNT